MRVILLLFAMILVSCDASASSYPVHSYKITLENGVEKVVEASSCSMSTYGEWGQGKAPITIVSCHNPDGMGIYREILSIRAIGYEVVK